MILIKMFHKNLKAINKIYEKHQLLQVNPDPYVECDPEVTIDCEGYLEEEFGIKQTNKQTNGNLRIL